MPDYSSPLEQVTQPGFDWEKFYRGAGPATLYFGNWGPGGGAHYGGGGPTAFDNDFYTAGRTPFVQDPKTAYMDRSPAPPQQSPSLAFGDIVTFLAQPAYAQRQNIFAAAAAAGIPIPRPDLSRQVQRVMAPTYSAAQPIHRMPEWRVPTANTYGLFD